MASELKLDEGSDAVVVQGGITVNVQDATITIDKNGTVAMQTAANDTSLKATPEIGAIEGAIKGKTAPEIGDEMADGTIYAGISPDRHKPMYARPKDESGTYTFHESAKRAKNYGGGFHVPTKNELNVLYENRNKGKLKGTFNETGSYNAGWYWSFSLYDDNKCGWGQRFSNGHQCNYHMDSTSSLRLVRW